jgi:hypothetical protein
VGRNVQPHVLGNVSFDAAISLERFPRYVSELALAPDHRVTSEAALANRLSPFHNSLQQSFSQRSSAAESCSDAELLRSTLAPEAQGLRQ